MPLLQPFVVVEKSIATLDGRNRPQWRNEYELILTLGTIPEKASPFVLLVRMGIPPEHEAEFNDWYNTDHVPALAGVLGVYGARRFRATAGSPTYLAMYELAHADVSTSDTWRKAADSP